MAGCVFGRRFDAKHPVCMSCGDQGVSCGETKKRKPKVREQHSFPISSDTRKGIGATYDLVSLNDVVNKHSGDKKYRQIKRVWQKLLRNAGHHIGHHHGKVIVEIIRFVPNRAHFMDKDNRYGAAKPIVDALRHEGVVRDDTDQFLDLRVNQEQGPSRVEIWVEVAP